MFGWLKNKTNTTVADPPLVIETADGALRRAFAGEQIGQLRRMLTDLLVGQRLPNRIGFTSALRNEGVTCITLASAVTLAHDTGKRVCVVELNWVAPGMLANLRPLATPEVKSKRKAAQPEEVAPPLPVLPGVADVLRGQATLDETLLATNYAGLRLLPAGVAALEQRPLLARGTELRNLLDHLNTHFDYVLLDLPAVLETSDTLALAALATAYAMVVRHGVTPVTEVRRALNDLQHVPVLGVILNQAHIATPRWIHRLIPQE
ncbi:CpsD/CapB family tyrosine-protein kinase [Chloroflexus sp.]|uniref:CpsD/CapB family tyrosine-protein kinase n=1 Tax=Chloroflexus sp. TaxID=1904827 RepID=UPI0026362801|nr:CpsD/CapB family tyrosine-protein kinase [uncultured Chloroflexus sp.]